MKNTSIKKVSIYSFIFLPLAFVACSTPQPGPDKTLAGAVLGAGWGAGAGAVIGNQVSYTGEGAAIGAGFGAVGGAMTGAGYDLTESAQLKNQRELASLKIQSLANQRELENVQDALDQSTSTDLAGGVYQVFFDDDVTSLKAGSIANLEVIAEGIKSSTRAVTVHVIGHTDDAGSPEYNKRLAEARAREVSSYLGARGISMDQIKVSNFGATRPIASNSTAVGRQLNRRVDIYISGR